jgi:hypothetical protein
MSEIYVSPNNGSRLEVPPETAKELFAVISKMSWQLSDEFLASRTGHIGQVGSAVFRDGKVIGTVFATFSFMELPIDAK